MLLVALNWYVGANVLLAVAYILLSAIGFAGGKLSRAAPYRVQIRFGRALIFAAILLPLGASLLGYQGGWATAAHVWSAARMEAVPPHTSGTHSSGVLTVSTLSLSIDQALHIVQWLFVAGFLFVQLRMLVELFATAAIIAGANHIRRSGRLRILASDRIQIPFSFWLPSRCFIVIPAGLLLRLDDLRFAICHEAQHHRQLDTGLLYLHLLCKSIFFWNPAAHWLDSRIRTLQELACDEAMVVRGRVPAQPYCESLLRIAESIISRRRLDLTVGMLNSHQGVLRQRIEMLTAAPPRYWGRAAFASLGMGALILMGAAAYAFSPLIQDCRVTKRDAAKMAAVAQIGSAFPITVNDQVLRELNRWLATPDGRTSLQDGLRRLQSRKASLSEQFEHSGLPSELLAVPLVESGYRNLEPSIDPRRGAGLWMFIAPTARRFGLTVESGHDDRLDERVETGVALRMLAHLHGEFNDWLLALLSYNTGSSSTDAAIRITGSRDAWQLAQEGYENDPDYLARVMAAVLIIKNPHVLD